MAFQIDFLPVGDGSRSGDAIALRYVMNGATYIHVVDGGTTATGDKLCDHILSRYNTDVVHFVTLTHGDDDHSSGLRRVIERMRVGAIYMNRPWMHALELLPSFQAEWDVTRLITRLRNDAPIMAEIEAMALARNIPIYSAYAGTRIGAFAVLAPTKQRYLELAPHFTRTPVAAAGLVTTPRAAPGGIGGLLEAAKSWIKETWFVETLSENVPDSPSNESSVIQYADVDGFRTLLTGDANARSLNAAANAAYALGINLPGLDVIQIPHHGSRRNVSPSALNRWLGPVQVFQTSQVVQAIASVAAGCTTHPRRKVVNAFMRRGCEVVATKGFTQTVTLGFPMHDGWGPTQPLPFSEVVEAET